MPEAKGKLTIQMDELLSCVGDKGNKQWVWLAIDTGTREIEILDVSLSESSHGNPRKASTDSAPRSTLTIGKRMKQLFLAGETLLYK